MGVDMNLSEVNKQYSKIKLMCQSYISGMEKMKMSISEFLEITDLKGRAYDSAKEYFYNTYFPLINGVILTSEKLIEAHQYFPRCYVEEVDYNSLKSDVLEMQISMLGRMAQRFEELDTIDPISNNIVLNLSNLYRMYQSHIKDKLNKLLAFNTYSVSIFTEVQSLLDNIRIAATELSNNSVWNPRARTFDLSKINMESFNNLRKIYFENDMDRLKNLFKRHPNLTEAENAELMQIVTNNQDRGIPSDLRKDAVKIFGGEEDIIGEGASYIKDEIKWYDILLNSVRGVGNTLVGTGMKNAIHGPVGENSFVIFSSYGRTMFNRGTKLNSVAKGTGYAVIGITTMLGIVDDIKNHDKTLGQAVSHNGLLIGIGIGAGVALSSNPIGLGILGTYVGTVLITAGANYLYDNVGVVENFVDGIGNVLDDYVFDPIAGGYNWISDKVTEGMDNIGEAINDTFDSINSMNWSW